MAKVLGYDDGVHVCDCCGKADLKGTFGVELDDGQIVFYGSVCVTRHLQKPLKEIKAEIDAEKQARVDAARAEFRASAEHAAVGAKMAEARELKLLGRAFKEHCAVELAAERVVQAALATKYNLEIYEV